MSVSLRDLPGGAATRFDHAAIRSVAKQIVAALERRGLGAVSVAPDEQDIRFALAAAEPPAEQRMRLLIFLPTVREMQSLAYGGRVRSEESANHPVHARILEHSPVQVGEVFRPREVEEYLARLNRHPGRRVAAQISPSLEAGRVYLDYQIAEQKPWVAYAQYQNAGTESTTEHQERTGFAHYQITDRDDILVVDYVTGNLDEVDAFFASYEVPVAGFEDRLRVSVEAGFSRFEANQESGYTARFDGEQWTGGLQLSYNAFQYRDLFVDVLGGARYQQIEADDKTAQVRGKDAFFLPHVGLLLSRSTGTSSVRGTFRYEWSSAGLAHTQRSETDRLGRTDPDRDFALIRWDASASFFVDPLIDLGRFGSSTPAHELFFSYRGQDGLGHRLIPHYQQVAGGFYTVRGYDQGATAGDDVQIATFEYRFHLPRIFTPGPSVRLPWIGEFALAPRQLGGRPDWDLILRTFYDVARIRQNARAVGEFDDRLRGTGVGAELILKDRLSVRLDWARGLDGARGGLVRSGGSEAHVNVTLFY